MPSSPPDIGVIIAAGGSGVRAGTGDPKQFRLIGGVPMLLRAIRPFASHPRVREIVVTLPDAALDAPPDWLSDLVGGNLSLVAGGDSRGASVQNGFTALSAACSGILVHDAARPFASRETVDTMIDRVSAGECAIAAVPVSDTLKRADGPDAHIVETVERAGLWRALTPQGFPRSALERAYAAGPDAVAAATDESALVEQAGYAVALMADTTTNIKVTTPDDFLIAEALAAR
jgi:2-C-methyl-D-erythritol 4-phosphate cytidylyltransferase